jgi:LysM repeat protein
MRKLANAFASLVISASLIACSPKQPSSKSTPNYVQSSTPTVVETALPYTIPTQSPTNYGHWDGKTRESCINTGGTWQNYFGNQSDGTFSQIGPQCGYGSLLRSYKIEPGDTIYGIGVNMGIPEEYIQEFTKIVLNANPGLVPERMIPGDYIAVPPLAVVEAHLKGISP